MAKIKITINGVYKIRINIHEPATILLLRGLITSEYQKLIGTNKIIKIIADAKGFILRDEDYVDTNKFFAYTDIKKYGLDIEKSQKSCKSKKLKTESKIKPELKESKTTLSELKGRSKINPNFKEFDLKSCPGKRKDESKITNGFEKLKGHKFAQKSEKSKLLNLKQGLDGQLSGLVVKSRNEKDDLGILISNEERGIEIPVMKVENNRKGSESKDGVLNTIGGSLFESEIKFIDIIVNDENQSDILENHNKGTYHGENSQCDNNQLVSKHIGGVSDDNNSIYFINRTDGQFYNGHSSSDNKMVCEENKCEIKNSKINKIENLKIDTPENDNLEPINEIGNINGKIKDNSSIDNKSEKQWREKDSIQKINKMIPLRKKKARYDVSIDDL